MILTYLDLFGIAVFAFSGGLLSADHDMDFFGAIVIGTITGIGGGTIRDLLIGQSPVFWVIDPTYVIICTIFALLGYFLRPSKTPYITSIRWADAIGLSTFAIIGAEKAFTVTNSILIATIMGIITACFGGLLRDVLCGRTPTILKEEVYATAAGIGSLIFLIGTSYGLSFMVAASMSFIVSFLIRAISMKFNLCLKKNLTCG